MKRHMIEELAEKLRAEIEGDAKANAQALFGGRLPDQVYVDEAEKVEYARSGWFDGTDGGAKFRTEMMESMQPEAFIRLAEQVLGMPAPPGWLGDAKKEIREAFLEGGDNA